MIFYPRQARDKHRGNSKKRCVYLQAVQKGASWHTVVKHEEIMKFVQNEWALYEEKTSS
jgi:hypothetical protein